MNKISGKNKLSGLSELKNRLLFTLVAIIIYRIGAHIPVPGIDPSRLANLFNTKANTILGLFNVFSGGAFSSFTVFALGLLPYISVSIVIQLLSSALPVLEQLKKEGEAGRRKINQYVRYGTSVLAFFQALALSKWVVSKSVVLDPGYIFYFTAIISLVTGTLFLVWLGEQISDRGMGNGTSLIIFSGIVSGLPGAAIQFIERLRQGQASILSGLCITVLIILITAFVVFIERAQRKIVISYPQRQQGRRVYSAQSSHLPLKVNMAGPIPPIFASTIMIIPGFLFHWLNTSGGPAWLEEISLLLTPGQLLYKLFFSGAMVFFCFFYTALAFNPRETADNLKKSGAFIPGIRPGEQSAHYIDQVMTRLTLAGCFYLLLVVLFPDVITAAWQVPVYFSGTSLLIIVVVVMDFITQIKSFFVSHHYESLLKKGDFRYGK